MNAMVRMLALGIAVFAAIAHAADFPTEDELRAGMADWPQSLLVAEADVPRILPGLYPHFNLGQTYQSLILLLDDPDRTYLRIHYDGMSNIHGIIDDRGHWQFDRGLLFLDSTDAVRLGAPERTPVIPIRTSGGVSLHDPSRRSQELSAELSSLTSIEGWYPLPRAILGGRAVDPEAEIGPDLFYVDYIGDAVTLWGGFKVGVPSREATRELLETRGIDPDTVDIDDYRIDDNAPIQLLSASTRLSADRRTVELDGPAYIWIGRTLLEAPDGMTLYADGVRIAASELREVQPVFDGETQWTVQVTRERTEGVQQAGPTFDSIEIMQWGFRTLDREDRINESLWDPAESLSLAREQFAELWPGSQLTAEATAFTVERTDSNSTYFGYPVRGVVATAPNGATCTVWVTDSLTGDSATEFVETNPFRNLPFFEEIDGIPLEIVFHSPALGGYSVRAGPHPSWDRAPEF